MVAGQAFIPFLDKAGGPSTCRRHLHTWRLSIGLLEKRGESSLPYAGKAGSAVLLLLPLLPYVTVPVYVRTTGTATKGLMHCGVGH